MHHYLIDELSCGDSVIHRLNPAVKLAVTLVFCVLVIVQDLRAVSVHFCFMVWAFGVAVLGGVPLRLIVRQVVVLSPFVLMLAVSGMFFDKNIVQVEFGPFGWEMTEGVLSGAAILVKFAVTMTALLGLVCTSRFSGLLEALGRCGVPEVLVVQLGFLYRYLFVLMDKAAEVVRGRSGRYFGYMGWRRELKAGAAMIGTLLVRSIESSRRINFAMQGRGFCGKLRTAREFRFGRGDAVFVLVFAGYMVFVLWLSGRIG